MIERNLPYQLLLHTQLEAKRHCQRLKVRQRQTKPKRSPLPFMQTEINFRWIIDCLQVLRVKEVL